MRRRVCLAALVASALGSTAFAEEPGDIVMDRNATANGVPAVVFPHWRHRTEFRCYACHPQIFEMEQGKNEITMQDLRAGEYCGRCHDGGTAFEVGFDTCRLCHSKVGP